jgi:tetratricopeptide (TPR) repeat protein
MKIRLNLNGFFVSINGFFGLGKYQEAIDACKKAIEIKPDYHEAYNTMGIAYIGLRKHQKAIDTFTTPMLR